MHGRGALSAAVRSANSRDFRPRAAIIADRGTNRFLTQKCLSEHTLKEKCLKLGPRSRRTDGFGFGGALNWRCFSQWTLGTQLRSKLHCCGQNWGGPWILRMTLLASCGAFAVAPTSSFAQNLVLNPGFESSTTCAAASWTSAGTCPITYLYSSGLQHSGSQDLVIGNFGSGSANISQPIVVVAGKYSFSFWYWVFAPGPGASFNASVGNHSFNISAAAGPPYTQFTQQFTLLPGTSTVAFATASGSSFAVAIDDVSLTFLGSLLVSPFLSPNAPNNPTNVAAAIELVHQYRRDAAGRLSEPLQFDA